MRTLILPTVAMATTAFGAGLPAPELTLTWLVDADEPIVLTPEGVYDAFLDCWAYTGTVDSAQGTLSLSYDLTVALDWQDPGNTMRSNLLAGDVAVVNGSDADAVSSVTLELPTGPVAAGAVKVGSMILEVTDHGGGGGVASLQGGALWSGLIDGVVVSQLGPWPASLECCALCTCQMVEAFGTPDPDVSDPLVGTLGLGNDYLIAAHQDALISSLFAVGTLVGDLDLDRTVGTIDFLQLIASWGPCPPRDCIADLDRNGVVDTVDFIMLLANWS